MVWAGLDVRRDVQRANGHSRRGTQLLSQQLAEPAEDLRHLLVLEELERRANISQRALGERLGLATSLVNRLIRELVDAGYVEIVDRSVRPYAYDLTSEGTAYRRRLSHEHYRSVLGDYRQVQERIGRRLRRICHNEVGRIVFYGSGDLMEATLPVARRMELEVVGLVDDDPERLGQRIGGLEVRPPDAVGRLDPDAVLITTMRRAEEVRGRLPDPVRDVRILEL